MAAFQLRYGKDINVIGEFGGNLNNGGERIAFTTVDGQMIQEFTYSDWYEDADGMGRSLVVVSTSGDYDSQDNWRASANVGGSPGAADAFVPLPGDSNGDGVFNQLDIVAVLQAGKYLTGEPATFSEGDWNGDGLFDSLDIVAALQEGNYQPGLAAQSSDLSKPSNRVEDAVDHMFAELDDRQLLHRV